MDAFDAAPLLPTTPWARMRHLRKYRYLAGCLRSEMLWWERLYYDTPAWLRWVLWPFGVRRSTVRPRRWAVVFCPAPEES